MLVNADFAHPALVSPRDYRWVASPQPGVERVMLDRLGGEKARATSIVRYASGSFFPQHPHPGGEEILVLSGTFSEGDEDYPEGWYLRNPPGSIHQPSSRDGAVIFVKLWQMDADETEQVRIDTRDESRWSVRDGRAVCQLFGDGRETVCLQRLVSGELLFSEPVGGAEILVLSGRLHMAGSAYECGSWLRLPQGFLTDLAAGQEGACIYLKTGRLDDSAGGR
ncbi:MULTISPECIES: cupin domain-containing protein [unclassified Pseudomonas]|uniref:cupin domain-containing protein n=1 Tax=unclassified Pseudomonas TaxID=196821 RepID=UPI0003E4E323|nr:MULTISPECIES: cupin domain-containing protein [unclassified Pseudomonas]MBB1604933.1 anti-sigma factor [Pseudomonas sp. UMC76]MBB1641882.1 anti-sigma factor [Pseudomonas sp. UME83]NTX90321.1 anti-sigma factor [Pseudomonas sp. UMA643]NTY21480.1 anti-sigma factor [Pseudomonas sp. UMC3103]NTY25592.1 anti-sigma factor [Pseudomonas sp. UMA603]